MTDFSALLQHDRGQEARTIHIVDSNSFDRWRDAQPVRHRTAIEAQRLQVSPSACAILPGEAVDGWSALGVVADGDVLSIWCLARLAETLPEGTYRVEGAQPGLAALGWVVAQYCFDRYRAAADVAGQKILLVPDATDVAAMVRIAQAIAGVRDMVNTPASDMGPQDLETAVAHLAQAHGAEVEVTAGAELEAAFPMIHAVGKAADSGRKPRLIELVWGNPDHPRIAIVGKGVCFDSGGLNIKQGAVMRMMKKDMGGAAHAIALAGLVMAAGLPVRLHLLVPAVENAISGNALRPGDVLTSRKGLTVEITNTDAEGRLILADALTRASDDAPELILDFATLTGAARTALGPELAALFTPDDSLAETLSASAKAHGDPLWRMPFWPGYDGALSSEIADLNNAPDDGFAGATVAAMFLRKFVGEGPAWAHFDIFAWTPASKPGRPKGGDAHALRASWAMLEARYAPATDARTGRPCQ